MTENYDLWKPTYLNMFILYRRHTVGIGHVVLHRAQRQSFFYTKSTSPVLIGENGPTSEHALKHVIGNLHLV